jgi:receptor expression-enhancing protein 5/6
MQVINLVSEKSGLPKKKVLYYALGLMVAFVVFGIGASIITNIVGVAYPAFMSFVALESEGADDDKMWLTYWVVFGSFNIFDQIVGVILRFIPFYYVLKLAFLIYCFHPSTNGSLQIYDAVILPYYQENKSKIDALEKQATDAANKLKNQATDLAKDGMSKVQEGVKTD